MLKTVNLICLNADLYCRAKKFDDKATWKANDDGTVNAEGPRVIVGGDGVGPSGGFITKYVVHVLHHTRVVHVSCYLLFNLYLQQATFVTCHM